MDVARIATGHQLAIGAAASYARMCRAAGSTLGVRSALRTTAEQAALYRGWVRRLPGYAFALPPGLSVHERGEAVDFTPAAFRWLEVYAADHGWRRTNPDERWHYEYEPARDRHRVTTLPAPPPPPEDDDDMFSDQDRTRAREIHAALGAGGAVGLPERSTVLGLLRMAVARVYRIPGTRALWLDVGTARRYLSPATHAALGFPPVTDLPVGDPLWALPIVGGQLGEVYAIDGRPEVWQLVGGRRRHVTAPEYASMVPQPPIMALPASYDLWRLPIDGATP